MSGKALAHAIGVSPPGISRLERKAGALEVMSVGMLRRYLGGIGYELRIVAVPTGEASRYVDVIEIVDPEVAEDADYP